MSEFMLNTSKTAARPVSRLRGSRRAKLALGGSGVGVLATRSDSGKDLSHVIPPLVTFQGNAALQHQRATNRS
jgi:hypothetical protein